MKKKNNAEILEILTWREAVRKRPAMYTGSIGNSGFVNLLKNFFANFYFFIDSSSLIKAEKLSIEITGRQSGKFRFEKLQMKIPLNINENLFFYKMDFSVLNALSRNYEFTLFDKEKNEILKQIYREGILQSGIVEEKEIAADSLEINFVLDDTIWEDFEINPYFISEVVKEIAFLKNDQTFEVKYSVNNESSRLIYHFENGLKDLINIEGLKGYGGIIFETDTEYKSEDFSADIALRFVTIPLTKLFSNLL